MKQHTTQDQTAKLIELGFERPKTIVDKYYDYDAEAYKEVNHYSIGELLEFVDDFEVVKTYDKCIAVHNGTGTHFYGKEIIDALFELCVQLKEEEVI